VGFHLRRLFLLVFRTVSYSVLSRGRRSFSSINPPLLRGLLLVVVLMGRVDLWWFIFVSSGWLAVLFVVSRSPLHWWVRSHCALFLGLVVVCTTTGSYLARNGLLLVVSPTISCRLVFCSHVNGQNPCRSLKVVLSLLLF
jgi:hypothetical protein